MQAGAQPGLARKTFSGEVTDRYFPARKPVSIGIPELKVFTWAGNKWDSSKIPKDRLTVKFGEDREKNDLPLKPSKSSDGRNLTAQLVCQAIKGNWIALKSGNTGTICFNGISKNQEIISAGGFCLVQSGDNTLLLSTRGEKFLPHPVNKGLKVSLKAKDAELTFNLTNSVLIGGSPIADLHMPGADFAAVISRIGNDVYLQPFHSSELLTGATGQKLPIDLRQNKSFMLCGHQFTAEIADAGQTPEPGSGVKPHEHLGLLLIEEDNSAGVFIAIDPRKSSMYVGRTEENDISIGSGSISKQHAQIIRYENCIKLVDCKSTNGTFVNGDKIGMKTVWPGDIIDFADVKFLLCYSDPRLSELTP